jgi:hypothetical protein
VSSNSVVFEALEPEATAVLAAALHQLLPSSCSSSCSSSSFQQLCLQAAVFSSYAFKQQLAQAALAQAAAGSTSSPLAVVSQQ